MYGQETKTQFLNIIATTTKGIKTICSMDGMPSVATVVGWLQSDPNFKEKYDEAKAMQQEMMFDEMMEIADKPSSDLVGAMDKKLQVDVRKWGMAKLAPKKYGENRNVNVDVGVKKIMTPDDMLALRQSIMATLTAPKQSEDIQDIEHEDVK